MQIAQVRSTYKELLIYRAWATCDLGGKNGGVLSMRMQVILDSPFARLGSAPIGGGKKGEFGDWTKFEGNLLRFVRARAHVRALMTRKSCAVGMRNAILRNCLNACFDVLIFALYRKPSQSGALHRFQSLQILVLCQTAQEINRQGEKFVMITVITYGKHP